ncbi:MAG TPA: hypothetical protein VMN36_01305 [Verrucomicrobiales bacterium]|nr:hypothetical protein [Verrucomicrobiales bacterium]
MRIKILLAVIVLTHMSLAQGIPADELPVRDHLILWIDASGQAAARRTASLPPILPQRGLDTLLDRSGNRRNFLQPLAERRPLAITDGETAFLRFDGTDDFLFSGGEPALAPELTVFILAAPHANPGGFTGLFSSSTAEGNDYTHGLNIDFGAQPTERLNCVNVESAGASGMTDLLVPGIFGAAERPFDGFHLFTVRSRVGETGIEFFLDGFLGGARPRLESMTGLDRMILGGRLYSNDPTVAPFAQGFFSGDFAAAAVYDRWLSDEERVAVEQSLLARVPKLAALAAGNQGHALRILEDPPPLQMLLPGFAVEEVSLKLGNLNGIRYRHDGKLLALGYDGRIHLIQDTDEDGIPDSSSVWWDQDPLRAPVGMALLPADDPRGDGAFIASKAKLSLILDRDRDGRAEEEIVAASGWPESFHGVDTLGAAIHPKDGSVYFSIGCANFVDAYLLDASGRSQYQIDSPRGTVQRLSPDLKTRETVVTGVRYLCGLAFNKDGDLFATEQEGATWLPNGNPFDELLHIVPGRHYGFPPRHPKHLPNVIDEPAVMEYAPQHQSACGLVFNEGVNGGPAFGPKHWHGDAIVCGQSRGKLWRTKLVSSEEGYVARSQLIACLNLLTVDSCVTPRGDLLVACHSGPPDWGTGPAGQGRLFLIRWVQTDLPQPVLTWAAAPDEFRIAFDRPLDPEHWAGLQQQVRIEAGEFVGAGDRFETVRPGYQVVRDQLASPRRWVELQSLQLTEDRRTLALRVPSQHEPVNYSITLPLPPSWRAPSPVSQRPEIDLAVDLHGVIALAASKSRSGKIVLPHPSLAVSQTLTEGSFEHESFFDSGPDSLTLQGRIDLSNIFQPLPQPGSTLDWNIETDAFANRRMSVRDAGAGEDLLLDVSQDSQDSLAEFSHVLAAGSRLVFALDTKIRPIARNRLYVPWAHHSANRRDAVAAGRPRSDVKGDWNQGRSLYFGVGACSTCHIIRGEGMAFGPDLSNLLHRDRDSVLADILQPSATINPDHAAALITLKDGSAAAGIVGETTPEKLVLRLPGGASSEHRRDNIATIEPMALSLMPEGLGAIFTGSDLEDLLTFLLTVPLEPEALSPSPPPPPRSGSETEGF